MNLQLLHHSCGRLRAAVRSMQIAAALSTILLVTQVNGQVDTPRARQARAALTSVQSQYGTSSQWGKLSRDAGLEDVAHELRAGDRADVNIFTAAVAALAKPTTAQFRESAFRDLAAALAARADELTPYPAAEWPEACRQTAEKFAPLTDAQVAVQREFLSSRLKELERRLPDIKRSGSTWHEFLKWPATQALATDATIDPAEFDRLETRWQNAIAVWPVSEVVEASFAARRMIRTLRSGQAAETSEQHAAAWHELAELLAKPDEMDTASARQVSELITGRERL